MTPPKTKKGIPTVLVVEDDELILDLMLQKLTKEKFNMLVAKEGEKAFELLGAQKPDLIVLDIILPGMNGFEILEKLKSAESTKSIPVIILSNLGQQEEIERGLKLGAEKFYIKAHVIPNDITEIINEALEVQKQKSLAAAK